MPGITGLVGLVIVAGAALGVAAGCVRYGGVEGIVDRARAKVAEYRPHPDMVPTPFSPNDNAALTLPSVAAGNNSGDQATAWQPGSPILLPLNTPVRTDESGTAAIPGGAAAVPSSTAAEAPAAGGEPVFVPAATATVLPVETRPATGATALPPPTAIPSFRPAQQAITLTNVAHYWQAWNNCGPATLAMDLSYFGSKLDQTAVAATLRPDKEDKNVNPEELAAFAAGQGLHALVRVNGSPERLKLLLSNGVPVIIETWMEPKPNDGMGHYRLLVGYDDTSREWIAYDSYDARGVDPHKPYAGIRLTYDELPPLWHVYDNSYVVVYGDEAAPMVAGILGRDMDDGAMWQRALAATSATLQTQSQDAFAWFNLGSELVALNRYGEAAQAYDHARQLGLPWRMLWYQFGPFNAYFQTQRYAEVIALADATLKTADNIEELYYWKGQALHAQGDGGGARQAWQRAVQLNKNYAVAVQALAQASR